MKNLFSSSEKGTRKYKGNLPLKCLNYGRIRHLPQSVLTQNKKIVMMKNLAVIRKIKRVKLYTRRNLIKIRKTSIPWKTMKMKG